MGDRQDTESSHVNYKVKPHPEVRVNSVQGPANLDRSNLSWADAHGARHQCRAEWQKAVQSRFRLGPVRV